MTFSVIIRVGEKNKDKNITSWVESQYKSETKQVVLSTIKRAIHMTQQHRIIAMTLRQVKINVKSSK